MDHAEYHHALRCQCNPSREAAAASPNQDDAVTSKIVAIIKQE